jgi:essential nuclear protein 1
MERCSPSSSTAAPREPPPGFNPKVVEVYTKVGQLLSRYKSGPLPKAFKILPTLSMWPQLVMLTNPEQWTPHATYAATRIFASNLDPKQSQKFYKEILLEKVREEIEETNKLSVQTYMALKKAIYKPAAFFKGLLFPLCEVRFLSVRFLLPPVLTLDFLYRAEPALFAKPPSSVLSSLASLSRYCTLELLF